MMTPKQRELARHALGFDGENKASYRNRFCAGPGSTDFNDWEDLVAKGLATKRTDGPWGGDHMFYLTFEGADMARNSDEWISMEEIKYMRREDAAEVLTETLKKREDGPV